MAKKGSFSFWKLLAYVFLGLIALALIAIVVIAVANGIACLVNHVGYVEQFKTWFPFLFKEETAEPVVEAAKVLVHNVRTLLPF